VSIKEVNYLFPLYLYSAEGELPGLHDSERRPNLADKFVADLEERLRMKFVPDGQGDLKRTFGPDDVFAYIYSVLHSPTYRERYSEFLKSDFARVPLTSNVGLFRALRDLGDQLIRQHTLEHAAPPSTEFPVKGTDVIEGVRYSKPVEEGAKKGRVWINTDQYFEGLRPEAWDFHVGGIRVAEKWLRDRKGLKLSWDDVTHYEALVAAATETVRLVPKIDQAIEAEGGWPLR